MYKEPQDDEKIHPASYVNKALEDLKAAKESHLKTGDEIDHSIYVLETGKDYWDNIDPTPFQITPSGTASVNFLASMAQEASRIKYVSDADYAQVQLFSASADTFGTVTSTAHSVICKVEAFIPEKINMAIDKPEKDEEYASKFDSFDAELGRLYRQILQVRRRTSSHPEKSILSDVRQAYDHLIRILAPDDEVRTQPDWSPIDPSKPRMVTRSQRLEYAVNKHIHDEIHRATILSSTKHIIAVHEELNELYHTEKPLDDDKAYAVSQSMIDVLNQWADALGL